MNTKKDIFNNVGNQTVNEWIFFSDYGSQRGPPTV